MTISSKPSTTGRVAALFPVTFWDEDGDLETFADPQEFGQTVEFLDERETRPRLEISPTCRSKNGERLRVQILSGVLVLCHPVPEEFDLGDLDVVRYRRQRETLLVESYRGEKTRALHKVGGREFAFPEAWDRPFDFKSGDWEIQATAPNDEEFHRQWTIARDPGVIRAGSYVRDVLRTLIRKE